MGFLRLGAHDRPRAVGEAKRRGSAGGQRPGLSARDPFTAMWAKWDWGEGPRIGGRRTNLFCAWLAWSRHRVVIPTWDRTLPTVIGCLDRAMRIWGGCRPIG